MELVAYIHGHHPAQNVPQYAPNTPENNRARARTPDNQDVDSDGPGTPAAPRHREGGRAGNNGHGTPSTPRASNDGHGTPAAPRHGEGGTPDAPRANEDGIPGAPQADNEDGPGDPGAEEDGTAPPPNQQNADLDIDYLRIIFDVGRRALGLLLFVASRSFNYFIKYPVVLVLPFLYGLYALGGFLAAGLAVLLSGAGGGALYRYNQTAQVRSQLEAEEARIIDEVQEVQAGSADIDRRLRRLPRNRGLLNAFGRQDAEEAKLQGQRRDNQIQVARLLQRLQQIRQQLQQLEQAGLFGGNDDGENDGDDEE